MSAAATNPEDSATDPGLFTCAAFRAAFVTTLDSLLRYSLDPSWAYERPSGIFDCFPMLDSVAPQIQLECLLRTWSRWHQGLADNFDLLDDCVLHAAREALSKISLEPDAKPLSVVLNGPRGINQPADHWLCSKTRCLQVAGQAPLRPAFLREFTAIDDRCPWSGTEFAAEADAGREELLNLLGRWVADRGAVLGSQELLTPAEQEMLQTFFEEHPGLAR